MRLSSLILSAFLLASATVRSQSKLIPIGSSLEITPFSMESSIDKGFNLPAGFRPVAMGSGNISNSFCMFMSSDKKSAIMVGHGMNFNGRATRAYLIDLESGELSGHTSRHAHEKGYARKNIYKNSKTFKQQIFFNKAEKCLYLARIDKRYGHSGVLGYVRMPFDGKSGEIEILKKDKELERSLKQSEKLFLNTKHSEYGMYDEDLWDDASVRRQYPFKAWQIFSENLGVAYAKSEINRADPFANFLLFCVKDETYDELGKISTDPVALVEYLKRPETRNKEIAETMLENTALTSTIAMQVSREYPPFEKKMLKLVEGRIASLEIKELDDFIATFPNSSKIEIIRRRKENLETIERLEKVEVTRLDVVAPKSNNNWQDWIRNSGNLLYSDAPYVTNEGEVTYFVRGEVKNNDDRPHTFKLRAASDLINVGKVKFLGMTYVENEKIKELSDYILVGTLQPGEIRPFVIRLKADRKILGTGINYNFIAAYNELKLANTKTTVELYTGMVDHEELRKQRYWFQAVEKGVNTQVFKDDFWSREPYSSDYYLALNESFWLEQEKRNEVRNGMTETYKITEPDTRPTWINSDAVKIYRLTCLIDSQEAEFYLDKEGQYRYGSTLFFSSNKYSSFEKVVEKVAGDLDCLRY